MAHEEGPASAGGRTIVRNIGLMLSGDLARPILGADSILVEDGIISAIGRAATMRSKISARSMSW